MQAAEIARQSIQNLRDNKLRSFMTLFGIAWGIVAIMILLGWGLGTRDSLMEGFHQIGTGLVIGLPGHTSIRTPQTQAGTPILPELDDVDYLLANIPLAKDVQPILTRQLECKTPMDTRSYSTRGVFAGRLEQGNWHVAQGRFISERDVAERRRFAFIGHQVRDELFGEDVEAEELTFRLGGVTFTVVGVARDKEGQTSQINSRHDETILIPMSTMQELWGDGRHFEIIFITPTDLTRSSELVSSFRQAMGKRHHFDPEDEEALMIFDFNEFEVLFKILTTGLTLLLGLIGITTLFVGGIGVMNIMLVTVQERTREIGVRMAVGARRRDIRRQFLAEATVITSLGGFIGFLIGSAILGGVSMLPLPETVPLPVNSPFLIAVVIIVMITTGIVSGYAPAVRASRMLPIQALRYERGEDTTTSKVTRPLWVSKTITGELVGEAVMELRTSRGRTFLTAFGIVWGITAVIILMGFGDGFRVWMEENLSQLGDKLVTMYGGRVPGRRSYLEARPVYLTMKDVEVLRYQPQYIAQVLPEVNCDFLNHKYGNEDRAIHTLGIDVGGERTRNIQLRSGRLINLRDVRENRRVVFIGYSVKDRLFGEEVPDPLGEYVRINSIRFKVIGVSTRKGMQNSINQSLDDDKALIPYTTAMSLFRGTDRLSRLQIEPFDRLDYERAGNEARGRLVHLHGIDPEVGEDAFPWFSQLEAFEFLGPIVMVMRVFLGGVGLLTLLIGGVGVMNVMFFIVTQRTREIGVRRAVGARQKHIFNQFMIESVMLVVGAGLVGFLLGMGINSGLEFIVNQMESSTELSVLFAPMTSMFVAVVAVIFIGAVGWSSGVLPALRAMRLDVVDSLRYE